MEFILCNYPILIVLAPLAASIYSVLPIGKAGDRKYGFGVFAHFVAIFVAVFVLGEAVSQVTLLESSSSARHRGAFYRRLNYLSTV